MDYSAITASASFSAVTTGVLIIFAALAGVLVVIRGGRALLSAIDGDDEDDDDTDPYDGYAYDDYSRDNEAAGLDVMPRDEYERHV